MEEKKVSFEVAKYIKEKGYPQDVYGHHYYLNGVSCYGVLEDNNIFAPTYIQVWLWLWREKHIEFAPTRTSIAFLSSQEALWMKSVDIPEIATRTDPEDAIAASVEYLVKNDLIK